MKTMVSNMTTFALGDVAREIKQKVPVGQELPTVALSIWTPGEVELAHWTKVSRPPSLRLSQRAGAVRASQGLPA